METDRILQAEDHDVTVNRDAIEVEQDVGHNNVPGNEVDFTKKFRKRTKEVQDHVRDLDDCEPRDDAPADARDHFVDKNPFEI